VAVALFEHPVINSPYDYPGRLWELDDNGQPTERTEERRRRAEFITPIPKPKKQKGEVAQQQLTFDEGKGLSTAAQQYEQVSLTINSLRRQVDRWRALPNPSQWRETAETVRLFQHWRHRRFSNTPPVYLQSEE